LLSTQNPLVFVFHPGESSSSKVLSIEEEATLTTPPGQLPLRACAIATLDDWVKSLVPVFKPTRIVIVLCFTHGAPRSLQELVQKCPCIPGSKWNLVFKERGKPEYPKKNLSEQSREPTTTPTHI